MQSLIPWNRDGRRSELNALNMLTHFRSDWDRLFDRMFDDAASVGGAAQALPLEITETDAEVLVRAEVPGIQPENLDIQLSGDVLTVSGQKVDESSAQEGARTWSERRFGRFERAVKLSCPVEADSVKAEHKHGVVTITLRKADAVRSRRIEVKSS
jgi:HSP20 family protein